MTNTTKSYGTYTGQLSNEEIKRIQNGQELDVYLIIKTIGTLIATTNQDVELKKVEITPGIFNEMVEAQYEIEYIILNTTRFGVEILEPINNEHVKLTASYMAWFKWWDTYTEDTLTANELRGVVKLLVSGKDVSTYRPTGTWK